ncbi:MFS transporter [Sphingopyxis lindanitolerans]|uniref:MFS transporter n=1 Tax=Sphingopyxis lindanitolerans TaxID=2054227 RepID=A0A2S8B708_9SPHN|nr:peptide MFS transporter [Sphingopyxis lindanitolerans]PQM28195.1 MFS transporter [Sphingopyxis lindanitolerans]
MTAEAEKSWFGHPAGLTILFLTQTWEQFSYYGMRAIVVYYMVTDLMMSQAKSSMIFGVYVAFFYLTPMLGGVITDRWLGRRRAIILGGAIMALGHFLLTFEPFFYAGLAVIVVGNGFFLPAIPAQIGDLYQPGDPRHAGAYNIYYVGINIGGFLAPFVCGTLGELYGWHWGFGAAGVGMLAGLLLYILGGKYLPAEPVRQPAVKTARTRFSRRIILLMLAVGFATTLFRGAYQQVGNTVAIWLESGVDRGIGDLSIPMTWFQALNPLFVFALTPLLLGHWRRRAAAGRERPAIGRMALGAALVALSFAMLAALAAIAHGQPILWPWLVAFFAVLTLGELYILPTGLYLFDRLAPPGSSAFAIAAWYGTIFTGSLFSGWVGTAWSAMSPPAFFLLLAGCALAGAAILGLLGRSDHSRPESSAL